VFEGDIHEKHMDKNQYERGETPRALGGFVRCIANHRIGGLFLCAGILAHAIPVLY
jgi:hypothetical protein